MRNLTMSPRRFVWYTIGNVLMGIYFAWIWWDRATTFHRRIFFWVVLVVVAISMAINLVQAIDWYRHRPPTPKA